MYKNAKIRIYPVGAYLLKVNSESYRKRCVTCSKLTKKRPERPHWHEDVKKHWRCSSISLLNFGKCCRLGLPAEIKVQTSKNYETCKNRYKLWHINQTGQTTIWKETRIEFIKYTECRLWANICEIYWDFRSARIISFQEKNRSGNHFSGYQWYVRCGISWPVSNKYIYEIYKGRGIYRHYFQADTLLFTCYCWRSMFLMKIDMKIKVF